MNARALRRLILEESRRAHVGHIGSALSVADIIAVLFGGIMHRPGSGERVRDRFVLSKGHAALALYAALHLNGRLTREQLATYCGDDSLLGVHPEHALDGIDFSTGSLGHGLAFGAGVALAARLRGAAYRAFVLVSDAECNEGSLWETAMFAAHHRLDNLVAIVDDNGQQALGKTRTILDLGPLADKWRAFGWETDVVDGHDPVALTKALRATEQRSLRPRAIIAHTVSGKGVSFMEGEVAWHYLPLDEEQFAQALAEVEAPP